MRTDSPLHRNLIHESTAPPTTVKTSTECHREVVIIGPWWWLWSGDRREGGHLKKFKENENERQALKVCVVIQQVKLQPEMDYIPHQRAGLSSGCSALVLALC